MRQEDVTPRGSEERDDKTRQDQQTELEAEQESAVAMDADVPQPSDDDKTTEGQPS